MEYLRYPKSQGMLDQQRKKFTSKSCCKSCHLWLVSDKVFLYQAYQMTTECTIHHSCSHQQSQFLPPLSSCISIFCSPVLSFTCKSFRFELFCQLMDSSLMDFLWKKEARVFCHLDREGQYFGCRNPNQPNEYCSRPKT